MNFFPVLLLLTLSSSLLAQHKQAYKVFNGDGKKSDYNEILKNVVNTDVVFFGELHDNPVAHWLELELTKDLYIEKDSNLILAAEMFETDNQILIDEYFAEIIKESSFESEVRLWKNYATDYKPLLNFARENGLKFVASNIPRRYASAVAAGGFDALIDLTPEALKFIAPLPIEYDENLPCYKDMLSMEGIPANHDKTNLPRAQAIKDATMANSILKYWNIGQMVIHYNGSYHSDRHMGIIWYLNKYNPSIKSATISSVIQDDIRKLDAENKNLADFVIVIPSSMTRTYK